MHKFPFLNQRQRVRLIWPCAAAALGCVLFVNSLAQSAPVAGNDGGPAALAPTNQTPTYLGNIRPIIMQRCARCHNEQDQFIYDWLNYKTAYANRFEIRRRVWNSWNGTYYKESMPVAN